MPQDAFAATSMLTAQTQVDMPEALRSIQDRFSEGGSLLGFLAGLAGFAFLVVMVFYFARRRERKNEWIHQPEALFNQMLEQLVDSPDRAILMEMAAVLEHADHSVILVSPAEYDRTLASWLENAPHPAHRQRAEELRASLFPTAFQTTC